MLTRNAFIRAAVLAGVVAAALPASGQMNPTGKPEVFEATLTGAQEVPPTSSTGTGTAEVQLNNDTRLLSWKVTYSGLTGPATGAHIHGPAGPGQNAAVAVPFNSAETQPIIGQTTITQQQASDLMSGLMYVNVHTAGNPGGEIRGQLRRRP